jgi:signal transduction histidine kinase
VPSSLSLLAAAAVGELVLIAALVAQWRRDRRILDQRTRQRAGVDTRAGALVHELNQPLTAILTNTQAAQRFLASDQVDLQELREILDDIVSDEKRAVSIVRSIRGLLLETNVSGTPAPISGNAGNDNLGACEERAL